MKKSKLFLVSLTSIITVLLLSGCENNMVVFNPEGPIARQILELINFSIALLLLVTVVVFGLFAFIVWKYRERKDNLDYEPPEEHGSTALEIIWTVIPILIIVALTIPTVKTIYAIDEIPKGYEDKKPLVINVTSADWKWIFSYPEQGIETVNYVNIPEDRPIDFKLTSAGTMQSFWVPALGGQKYSMAHAETQLYLVADNPGSFVGRNTNFNGQGYAGMEFEVLSQTQEDFDQWIKDVKETAPKMTLEEYEKMLEPSHFGRKTFSNSHLEWVDHSDPHSKNYTNPELYDRGHGWPGKIFEDKNNYKYKNTDSNNSETMNQKDSEAEDPNGGGHSGH
ncbi:MULTISPECIES: cytochrome aa3 quinol oxidase subunit II [Mesobacillus]|uniref:Quinol oxidase subunit 2 n=2 Tax=Mesobacillus TaxID=2675231 RepID=A0A0D6ZCL7_9BACI|nr:MULTISPECIES: cytochrome aa3 quinol oxidase subunit II [Mesobacillus]KIY22796.1 quinol oxidase subunit 2 [Mesobacillus subterraneus]MDQ0413238.1 cytochrome aa3-600 menaquinol oxidase subunit 2 [Mesobacillus stamsii]